MLAQPLARRVLQPQLWARTHQVYAVNESRRSLPLASCQCIAQIRHARTKAAVQPSSKPASPVTQTASPPATRSIELEAQSFPIEPPEPATEGTKKGPSVPRSKAPKPRPSFAKAAKPNPAAVEYSGRLSDVDYDETQNQQAVRSSNELLGDHDRVLLYTSPWHGGLVVTSIVAGTAFSSSAGFLAQGLIYGGPWPAWMLMPSIIAGGLVAMIGVHAFTVTLKTIDKVWVLRDADSKLKLRMKTKWSLYFWQPRYIEVPLLDVHLDRTIEDRQFSFLNVPLEQRYVWTELDARNKIPKEKTTWREKLNNAWPQFKRDVGRTYARQGIARVRIGKDIWRLDTHMATLLYAGMPLAAVTQDDEAHNQSTFGIVRQHMIGF